MKGRLVSLVVALGIALAIPAAATAAPPEQDASLMVLSSWSPTFSDRVTMGGTMTVTVMNVGRDAASLRHPLSTAPCECSIVSATADIGTVGESWSIDDLAPGRTATLVVEYTSVPPETRPIATSDFANVESPTPSSVAWFDLGDGLRVA